MQILPGRGAFCALCLSTGGDFPLAQSCATKRIDSPSTAAGSASAAPAQTGAAESFPAAVDSSSSKRPMGDSFGELVAGKVWP